MSALAVMVGPGPGAGDCGGEGGAGQLGWVRLIQSTAWTAGRARGAERCEGSSLPVPDPGESGKRSWCEMRADGAASSAGEFSRHLEKVVFLSSPDSCTTQARKIIPAVRSRPGHCRWLHADVILTFVTLH